MEKGAASSETGSQMMGAKTSNMGVVPFPPIKEGVTGIPPAGPLVISL